MSRVAVAGRTNRSIRRVGLCPHTGISRARPIRPRRRCCIQRQMDR